MDFTKLITNVNLINSVHLDPEYRVNSNTGEIDKHPTSEYKGLLIKHLPTQTIIQGSLHKYYHNVNYNDYSFKEIGSSVIDLCNTFELDPQEVKVVNLEFGVNVHLANLVECNKFLNSCLTYKGKKFNYKRFANGARYIELEFQRYVIKIYNKGLQVKNYAPLLGNVLRFEVKGKKSVFLSSYGITTIADLLNPINYLNLLECLKNAFEHIFYNEWTIHPTDLIKSHKELLTNWQNLNYIETLHNEKRNTTYKNEFRAFKELEAKYGANETKNKVWQLIQKKWFELLELDLKTYTKLTDFLGRYSIEKVHQINNLSLGLIQYDFTSVDLCKYLLKISKKKEPLKCIKTHLSIEDQKPNSKFLSAKKIGYNEAHRLRNLDSNPRNKLRYKIEQLINESKNQLFEPEIILTNNQLKELEFWKGSKYYPLENINYGIR